MSTKAIITLYELGPMNQNSFTYNVCAWDDVNDINLGSYSQIAVNIGTDITAPYTETTIRSAVLNHAISYLAGQSITVTAGNVLFLYGPQQPTSTTLAFSSASRSLNSAFQISTTNSCLVSYSVDISCTLSLTSGQQGTVYLEYADDSGFTTNVVEVCRTVNGNTGSLTIGLNITQNATGTLSGIVPVAKYVRLRTQNNTGSPTFNYRSGQEVQIS